MPAFSAELVVVKSNDAVPYDTFIEAFSKQFVEYHIEVKNMKNDLNIGKALLRDMQKRSDISAVVTLGAKASWLFREEMKFPVVFSMLSNPARFGLAGRPGVEIDVSLEEGLRKVLEVLPDVRRIGILYSNSSADDVKLLRSLAKQKNITIIAELVDTPSQIPAAFNSLIQTSDAAWLLVDNVITASQLVITDGIILPALKNRFPLIGFNKWSVTNGALFCLASEYDDIASQTADLVRRVLIGSAINQSEVPKNYRVYFNPKVMQRITVKTTVNMPADAYLIR